LRVLDLIVLSIKNLRHAGTRTALCVLAIGIGISSVSTVLTLGFAAGLKVTDELARIGVKGIAFYTKSGHSFSDEAIAAVRHTEGVTAVMPLTLSTGSITLRSTSSTAGILGINESLDDVFQLELLHGSLPDIQQIRAGEKIVVVEDTLAQSEYQRTNIVGKHLYVTIDGITEKMKICGVIRSQSASLSAFSGTKLPYLIYLPYTTIQNMVKVGSPDKIIAAVQDDNPDIPDKVITRLNRQFGNQYAFENLNQYADIFSNILEIVSLLISGIASISVVVGGLGVMNAMVSSVDARTSEIGIYRALGARKHDIVGNYLCEAMLLCLTGGILGIILNTLLLFLINEITGLMLTLQVKNVALGLTASGLCGVVFGLLPAVKAARLSPIEAIRRE